MNRPFVTRNGPAGRKSLLEEARRVFASLLFAWSLSSLRAAESAAPIEVGISARDITPEGPIWLAGYAARKHPSDKVDSRLRVQAMAYKGGAVSVVLVSLYMSVVGN